MKYTDVYLKSALPIFLINFSMYIVVLLLIMCNKMLQQSEIDRLKRLALRDKKESVNKVEMSKFKRAISKTLEFAELHFRWNGLIRTNLLIYQNFTLGLFLNIRKGWDVEEKPVLKVSYILSWLSLLFVWCNGYIFYYLVEKYTRTARFQVENAAQLEKDKLAKKAIAQPKEDSRQKQEANIKRKKANGKKLRDKIKQKEATVQDMDSSLMTLN